MSVNKSQGQTLAKALAYLLDHQLFGHGQLYVDLSRGRRFGSVMVLAPTRRVRNVAWAEMLLDE